MIIVLTSAKLCRHFCKDSHIIFSHFKFQVAISLILCDIFVWLVFLFSNFNTHYLACLVENHCLSQIIKFERCTACLDIEAVHLSTNHRFGYHFFRFLGVHRCCLQTVNI